MMFVFHGGSGSDIADIKEAIKYGVIKMNIDTDTQWAYWSGIREFEAKYHDYLQTQIGNPEGESKPNKKYYDPRMSVRSAEESTVERLKQCFEDLNCVGILGLGDAPEPSNVLGPRRAAGLSGVRGGELSAEVGAPWSGGTWSAERRPAWHRIRMAPCLTTGWSDQRKVLLLGGWADTGWPRLQVWA